MNNRSLVTSLVLSLVVLVAGIVYLATGATPNLGLDLQGGISAIYSPVFEEGEERPEDFDEVLDETLQVIRGRVDSLGVAEPEISRQGDDVLVQLPGLDDAERAQELIGTTAKMTFRPVTAEYAPGSEAYDEQPPCEEVGDLGENESGLLCDEGSDDPRFGSTEPTKYEVGPSQISGDRVSGALAVFSGNGWSVQLDLDEEGGQQFADITGELACLRDQGQPAQLAIVLDGVIRSAPQMNPSVLCGEGITGGTATITVGGGALDSQQEEAQDLALVLKTGSLPITLEPSTFETVSPTLGEASLRSGLVAGLIGLALVAVYLVFFYRWLGLVAIIQLGMFGVIMLSTITLLGEVGFSLTLAGIAGIIVSVGITADSSILYFERIRDEANLGRTMRSAVKVAFGHAFRTNLAGNTVTFTAAVVLYLLAVGPVRGFALTLGLATLLDLLILGTWTRGAVGLLGQSGRLTRASVRADEDVTVRRDLRRRKKKPSTPTRPTSGAQR